MFPNLSVHTMQEYAFYIPIHIQIKQAWDSGMEEPHSPQHSLLTAAEFFVGLIHSSYSCQLQQLFLLIVPKSCDVAQTNLQYQTSCCSLRMLPVLKACVSTKDLGKLSATLDMLKPPIDWKLPDYSLIVSSLLQVC